MREKRIIQRGFRLDSDDQRCPVCGAGNAMCRIDNDSSNIDHFRCSCQVCETVYLVYDNAKKD